MVIVNFQFGLLIRKAALTEKNLSVDAIFTALEVRAANDENEEFLSFGPHFGVEAVQGLTDLLSGLGLQYWDDFFETTLDHPDWCQFYAVRPDKHAEA